MPFLDQEAPGSWGLGRRHMDHDTREEALHRRARKRAEDLRRFYIGVMVYLVVNLCLFLINISIGGSTWFYWPLLIWGIFVVIDGISLFLRGGPLGADWEERKVRQLIDRERMRGGASP